MALTRGRCRLTATSVSILAHLLGVAVTVLVLVWILRFEEGLAFKSDTKHKILNVHVLFMILGPVLAAGEGTMVYQMVHARRRSQKFVHLVFHFVGLVLGIMGIYAVFKYHSEIELWNMYTLHSWFGMITICASGLQWLLGFFTYFLPGAEKSARATLLPWHIFIGMAIFILAICTAEIGLAQLFIRLGLIRSQEALIVNFTGLLIFLFAASVSLTVFLRRGD